jgi:hypothetical protein
MVDRIRHFRAGLLLALSALVVFWPISYWLPLPEYLSALASEDYADYQLALRLILVVYFLFFILNLITAGLSATKLSSRLKFYLALVPAALLFVLPIIFVIPAALSFPDRNYFEVFQAMYRLLRYTTPQLLALAIVCTLIAVAINVRAALIFRAAPSLDVVPNNVRNRYFIYAGVFFLVLAIVIPVGAFNASLRSMDRAACARYAALEVPQIDSDVPIFLSEIRVIGESAGNKSLQNLLINFSDISRQYLSLLDTEDQGSLVLKQYGDLTAKAKDEVAIVCSEYAVK